MEMAIPCQVLAATLHYLRVAVTRSRALDMTSHTRTLSCPRSSGNLPEWKERLL